MTKIRLSTYEVLAAEYYDPIRHPTCANFREASAHCFDEWLRTFPINWDWICEVGPGKSLLAELLLPLQPVLGKLILVDSSPSMLSHSCGWSKLGAHLILGDAAAMPLRSESIDLLVSCLGDSYNDWRFWEEVGRVLKAGALCLFSTPSFDWAMTFRGGGNKEELMTAEFELVDGRQVRVPSWIYPIDEQSKIIERNGLAVINVAEIPISSVRSPLSPKLMGERGPKASIVTGYVIAKKRG